MQSHLFHRGKVVERYVIDVHVDKYFEGWIKGPVGWMEMLWARSLVQLSLRR